MEDKKEIISNIYQEAKQLRLVSNQDEFAQRLGFSNRMHLFGRLLKGEGEITDNLVKKAQQLLDNASSENVTNGVTSRERIHFIDSLQDKIGELSEDVIYLRASDRIQGMWIAELSALLKKTSFAGEALQLEESVRREVDRLLGESKRK